MPGDLRHAGDKEPLAEAGEELGEAQVVVLESKGDAAWAAPLPADWGPVHRLQWMLRKKYGYKLKVDGDFGPLTLAAVKNFQQKAGLAVDGVVGRVTWAKVLGR